jgi:hypothetical protein
LQLHGPLQDGPSTAARNLTTGSGIDPSTFTEEASEITEDQLGLDRSAASPGSASTLLRRHDGRTVPPLKVPRSEPNERRPAGRLSLLDISRTHCRQQIGQMQT